MFQFLHFLLFGITTQAENAQVSYYQWCSRIKHVFSDSEWWSSYSRIFKGMDHRGWNSLKWLRMKMIIWEIFKIHQKETLKTYDKGIRPWSGVKQLTVSAKISAMSVNALNQQNMQFDMNCIAMFNWQDPRRVSKRFLRPPRNLRWWKIIGTRKKVEFFSFEYIR